MGPGDANGYLGLAPYSGTDKVIKSMNFIQGLKERNVTKSNMFALFLDHYRANSSTRGTHIKFGGYDTDSIEAGSTLEFARTLSDDSWNIQIASAIVGGKYPLDF